MTSTPTPAPTARVLVTGAAGYVGSVLVRAMMARGHDVVAVDRLYFGSASVEDLLAHPRFRLRVMDVARLTAAHLQGIDVVVDLAAVSNDAAGDIDPSWTVRVNQLARARLAQLARAAGVRRHVLVSSTSVYGRAGVEDVDEHYAVDPLTTYALTAVKAEAAVLHQAALGLDAVVLRLGTVYGLSPRMRFDVVVNTMTLSALRRGVIELHGSGRQWRPHVAVADVCSAILNCIDAAPGHVAGEIVNVCHSNLRITEVAAQVCEAVRRVTDRPVEVQSDGAETDIRNYRVNSNKSRSLLDWQPQMSIGAAATELAEALRAGHVTDAPHTYTANWYRNSIRPASQNTAAKDFATQPISTSSMSV